VQKGGGDCLEENKQIIQSGSLVALILIAGVVVFALTFQMPHPSISGQNSTVSDDLQSPQASESSPVTDPGPSRSDELWNMIDSVVVEKNCLAEAKKSAGSNAWAVRGCSCSAQQNESRKVYACSVSALDGSHPVGIDCIKELGYCEINSEQGVARLTFEQLQQIVAGN